MTLDELKRNRVSICITALQEGVSIPYKVGWSIFFDNHVLYQTCYSSTLQRNIIHKSGITVTEFLNFINSISDDQLKILYGNISLVRLQRKLLENGKIDEEPPNNLKN
jgi:hypothetical protein